jgi:hypothetical protein
VIDVVWLTVGVAVFCSTAGVVAGAVATMRKMHVILARMSPDQIDTLAALTEQVKRSA